MRDVDTAASVRLVHPYPINVKYDDQSLSYLTG
jgi:hypothetical protein